MRVVDAASAMSTSAAHWLAAVLVSDGSSCILALDTRSRGVDPVGIVAAAQPLAGALCEWSRTPPRPNYVFAAVRRRRSLA